MYTLILNISILIYLEFEKYSVIVIKKITLN